MKAKNINKCLYRRRRDKEEPFLVGFTISLLSLLIFIPFGVHSAILMGVITYVLILTITWVMVFHYMGKFTPKWVKAFLDDNSCYGWPNTYESLQTTLKISKDYDVKSNAKDLIKIIVDIGKALHVANKENDYGAQEELRAKLQKTVTLSKKLIENNKANYNENRFSDIDTRLSWAELLLKSQD
jgi:hypothetical protein